MLAEPGLDRWPHGGNRRGLERRWLAEIESTGIRTPLPQPPPDAPPQLHEAVEQFNSGEFWDCHETLEGLWLATPYPLRFFYHSIIKVAVGFYHMSRHNRHGASVKLADGVRLLSLFTPRYMGVDTGRLLEDCRPWFDRVAEGQRVDWGHIDRLVRPTIRQAA